MQLGITERTVKAHLTNIYNKLGVDSRAAAVSVGIQRGLIRRCAPPHGRTPACISAPQNGRNVRQQFSRTRWSACPYRSARHPHRV